jgi:sialidase-1
LNFTHYALPVTEATYASFPSVAVHGGHIYIAYRQAGSKTVAAAQAGSPTHHDNDSRIMLTYSTDEGKSWNKPIAVFNSEFGVNDPGLCILRSGRLLLRVTEIEALPSAKRHLLKGPLLAHREDLGTVSGVTGNYLLTSDDKGHSWSAPKKMDWGLHSHAISREPIVELADGTLLVSVYESRPQATEKCFLLRSFDGGETWRDAAAIAADPRGESSCYQGKNFNETAILSLASNRLLAVIRTDESYFTNQGADFMTVGGVGNLHTAISENSGLSWSSAQPTQIFGQPAALTKLPNGQICMVYGKRQHPYSIGLRMSSDEGRSWSDEHCVRKDAPHWDMGYPSVATSQDRIYVAYYWQNPAGQRVIELSVASVTR